MSTLDPRKSVLERLQNRERNRDLRAQEKTTRRWSAESGRDVLGSNGRRHHERKATSPQYLPRLKTPPEWPRDYQHEGDLRRGKMSVVPPLGTKELFASKRAHKKSQPPQKIQNRQTNQNQWVGGPAMASGLPVVPYGQPQYQPNGPGMPSNSSQPYPPGMYPVPMYMSYAPVFLPHIQNAGGYPMGMVDGRQFYQRRLTRDEAATRIQKYFRGWKERKNSRYLQLKFLTRKHFARDFIEDLISDFLQEEIIPDLLIQLLSHKKFLSPHDPLYRISSDICTNVIDEDVSMFLHQIAAGVFYSQLKLENISSNDPLVKVCQKIIDEVVDEMAVELVSSTLKSLVRSHMTMVKSDDWIEDLILETIQPMITNVATTTLEGYKYESTAEEIVNEVTDDLMKPVIVEAWKEVIDSHRDVQILEIGKCAGDRVLDSLFLEHLLSHLAGNNLSLYFRDYMEQTMDGLVCGVLLHQYMLVEKATEDTLSNYVVMEYHQKSYANMALDVILDEMCAHLDEDMQDLLEKERVYNTDGYS